MKEYINNISEEIISLKDVKKSRQISDLEVTKTIIDSIKNSRDGDSLFSGKKETIAFFKKFNIELSEASLIRLIVLIKSYGNIIRTISVLEDRLDLLETKSKDISTAIDRAGISNDFVANRLAELATSANQKISLSSLKLIIDVKDSKKYSNPIDIDININREESQKIRDILSSEEDEDIKKLAINYDE